MSEKDSYFNLPLISPAAATKLNQAHTWETVKLKLMTHPVSTNTNWINESDNLYSLQFNHRFRNYTALPSPTVPDKATESWLRKRQACRNFCGTQSFTCIKWCHQCCIVLKCLKWSRKQYENREINQHLFIVIKNKSWSKVCLFQKWSIIQNCVKKFIKWTNDVMPNIFFHPFICRILHLSMQMSSKWLTGLTKMCSIDSVVLPKNLGFISHLCRHMGNLGIGSRSTISASFVPRKQMKAKF